MNKILVTTFAIMLAASPVLACDTCGNDSGSTGSTTNTTNVGQVNNGASATNGSTTTLAPNQGQSQTNNTSSSAAPVGQQSNVQVNNNQTSISSFGGGVSCQESALAVSGYSGQQTSPGYSNSGSYGITASLLVPLGGRVQSNCTELSTEIVKQKKLSTCIELITHDLDIDQALAPELFAQCSMIHRHVSVTTQQTIVEKIVPVVQIQRVPYVVEKRVVVQNSCDSTMTPSQMHALVREEKYLIKHRLGTESSHRMTVIRQELSHYCNQDAISLALDANGSQLP